MHDPRKPLAFALGLLALAAPAAAQTGLDAAAKKAMRDATNPAVRLRTTMGDITLELFRKEAPKTTANFLAYVKAKHYDGTIFHRVLEDFMIQGGGLDKELVEKPTRAPIANESSNGFSNGTGTVAMARLDDPNSAKAQFFINLANNSFLDAAKDASGGYAVFGKVLAGMDVVKSIGGVRTAKKGAHEAVPLVPVVIKTATTLQP